MPLLQLFSIVFISCPSFLFTSPCHQYVLVLNFLLFILFYFIFIFILLSHSPPYSSGGDNVMMVFRACGW